MHVNLQLTDDTELRAHGHIVGGSLFAEVQWDFPNADTSLGEGVLWGSPDAMRRLAALASQAARQAEEEAAWHAHAVMTAAETGRVA